MKADLIIHNIQTLYTPYLKPPVKGSDMSEIKIIQDCFVAVHEGIIIGIGQENMSDFISDDTVLYDAKKTICIPGFIDGHSHLVHAGSREDEFQKLRSGVPYLDILKDGGGILNTVAKTVEADFQTLYEKARKSLNIMLSYGITTLEVKSGYGLSFHNELKQLEVAKVLNTRHPIDLYPTYMGAHAVPIRHKDDKEAYIQSILDDLYVLKDLQLAKSVDVFCEAHVFDLDDSKRILERAKSLGFDIRLHADEIEAIGGTALGLDLQAKSVDHLMVISDQDIKALSQSQTIANVLPGTSFYLNKPYAPARKMIDQGVALGIGGDYNPGSCPTENYLFILQLAANHMKLSPHEILTAATINPAFHLDLSHKKGSIEVGKQADLVLMDAPNLNYVFYHFGINHVQDVFINGKHVLKHKMINKELL